MYFCVNLWNLDLIATFKFSFLHSLYSCIHNHVGFCHTIVLPCNVTYGKSNLLSLWMILLLNATLVVQQAAVYGKCVAATTTGRQELRKDLCAKEFEALKTCFTNAVRCACPTFTLLFWKWFQRINVTCFFFSFLYCRPRKKPNKSAASVRFSHMVLAGPVSCDRWHWGQNE